MGLLPLYIQASRQKADGNPLIEQMTRLFEDAQSTAQWREMGFFPVLNEHDNTAEANREAGVMYRLLQLKLDHPLPNGKLLPDSFDLSLDRKQSCPKPETVDAAKKLGIPGVGVNQPSSASCAHTWLLTTQMAWSD